MTLEWEAGRLDSDLDGVGFDTLAVRIWSATSEGFFARAALPALLMVLVAAASLWFVLREERGW